MPKILLVGTGITSAVTGSLLKQHIPHAELILWDKARGVGGRMCTHRCNKDPESTLDLGAQYISTNPDYAKIHQTYYDALKQNSLLAPLVSRVEGMKPIQEGLENYIAPKGISSIVKHFLQEIKSDIKFQHHVETIDREGSRWNVVTRSGVQDSFDMVILTMPVPQILTLSGEIKRLIDRNKLLHKQLRDVEYSSRFALGLFYDKDSGVQLNNNNCAEYIPSDPIMKFVSIDTLKRCNYDSNHSVVFHTSVPFGKAHLEKSKEEVESTLLAKVRELYPHWPEPLEVRTHKWRYSQVTSAYFGLPGAIEIGEGLIAGGDGFTQSNFDLCIESARAILNLVLNNTS